MSLAYDVFVNDPPSQDGLLPNGEPKRFSPMASTLIYGPEDAVLTDPGMTEEQARVLGDWVAAKDRNVTGIFISHNIPHVFHSCDRIVAMARGEIVFDKPVGDTWGEEVQELL